MRVRRFFQEVAASPYYRRHPIEALQFAYAKWMLSRFRVSDPNEFLRALNIDTGAAMGGFQKWLPELREVVSRVWKHRGQGGVSMEDGMVLYGLTRALKPDYVIETGVAAGLSTSFICAGLIDNGQGMFYSIELPPEASASRTHPDGGIYDWPEGGPGWAIPEGFKRAMGSRHAMILQDVREALPALLERLPYVDLFFHDDLHTPDHMLWEFELVWPRLRSSGFLVSDDVNFGWLTFSRKLGLGNSALCNIQRLSAIRKG